MSLEYYRGYDCDESFCLAFVVNWKKTIVVFKMFLLDDIGALQWKLAPPLEGEEEKEEVDFKEMFSELDSFVQRIEDLKIEVTYVIY